MDDKSKKRPQDAQRVNMNEDYEVRYWDGKIGCHPCRPRKGYSEGRSDGQGC